MGITQPFLREFHQRQAEIGIPRKIKMARAPKNPEVAGFDSLILPASIEIKSAIVVDIPKARTNTMTEPFLIL